MKKVNLLHQRKRKRKDKLRIAAVIVLPALRDNYMYLIHDEKSGTCAAVDPVEPQKVLEECRARDGH